MLSEQEKREMLADGLSRKRRHEVLMAEQKKPKISGTLDEYIAFLMAVQKIKPFEHVRKITRAEKNMRAEDMRLMMKGLGADAQLSYTNLQSIQQTQLYHNGMMPTSNLLNPVAWLSSFRTGKRAFTRKNNPLKSIILLNYLY